jgi:glycosyltransferase involved in cell wall biosynthesis
MTAAEASHRAPLTATAPPLRSAHTPYPLQILFDGRKLEHGGIGVYAHNLIAGLVETPGVAVTVIGDPAVIARHSWAPAVTTVADVTRPYSFAELCLLGRRLRRQACDVFHTPHYVLPLGLEVPTVVTVHDLIQVRQPERFYYPLVAGGLVRSALRRADRVVTVSEASRRDLVEFSGDPAVVGKITVVPNAIDPVFLDARAETPEREYLLAVLSMAKPHKGLASLLEAFAWARARSVRAARTELVIVGYGADKDAVTERARHAGIADGVRVLGRVDHPTLAALYAGARGLVCPSRAEGFCLPVLEAHGAGTPVVVTPVPAVRELVTPADIVCDDFSTGALGRGILALLDRATAVTIDRGVIGERFGRAGVAARTLEIYRGAWLDFHAGRAV